MSPHSLIFFLNSYLPLSSTLFFFTDPAPTEIYTLSLHDALPICLYPDDADATVADERMEEADGVGTAPHTDRKSTRLNSSHRCISYAVFCLKKKKKN